MEFVDQVDSLLKERVRVTYRGNHPIVNKDVDSNVNQISEKQSSKCAVDLLEIEAFTLIADLMQVFKAIGIDAIIIPMKNDGSNDLYSKFKISNSLDLEFALKPHLGRIIEEYKGGHQKFYKFMEDRTEKKKGNFIIDFLKNSYTKVFGGNIPINSGDETHIGNVEILDVRNVDFEKAINFFLQLHDNGADLGLIMRNMLHLWVTNPEKIGSEFSRRNTIGTPRTLGEIGNKQDNSVLKQVMPINFNTKGLTNQRADERTGISRMIRKIIIGNVVTALRDKRHNLPGNALHLNKYSGSHPFYPNLNGDMKLKQETKRIRKEEYLELISTVNPINHTIN
jgi:hypothetical protein